MRTDPRFFMGHMNFLQFPYSNQPLRLAVFR
jgi:hypothetical protein